MGMTSNLGSMGEAFKTNPNYGGLGSYSESSGNN